MIKNYKFRGNYFNFRTICYLLGFETCKEGLPGFHPGEVDYETDTGEKGTVELSAREGLFFCRRIENQRRELLEQIILSRAGDIDAEILLKQNLLELVEASKLHYDNLELVENEYLIPSSTLIEYPADQISHKGVNLLHLTQDGYPVPDFCILSSNAYLLSRSERKKYIQSAIANLEKMTAQKLDSDKNPLVFAIRTAMPSYIPGVMPTFLNVGVTKKSYEALCKIYGKIAAGKIHLNNLQTLDIHLFGKPNDAILTDTENLEEQIEELYKKISARDEKLLTDALYQVFFFVKRAHEYYELNQDLLLTFFHNKEKYLSLILQKMVWTVRDDESYPGVLYSRHSRTGLGIQVESLPNIFGEEIMTGLIDTLDHEFFDRESIKPQYPAVYHFEPSLSELEKKLQSPVTVEFAAESGDNTYLFAVLQLNESELTGRATLLSSIDLYQKGVINATRVIDLIKPYHLNQIFSDRIDGESFKSLTYFCKGVSILPRTAVSARIYFSAAKVLEAKRKGEKVVFCKESFIPADTLVMGEVDAILSFTPAAIHVVTACRGYGVPAFLNLEKFGVELKENCLINEDGLELNEGEWITVSSKRQKIYLGKADFKPARFQSYLDGDKLEMHPKEERVFVNMAKAFLAYDELVENLKLDQIVKLDELIKLMRTNMRKKPKKAAQVMNSWFDKNTDMYWQQILESELGSHQDQHKLYKMLTLDRKVTLFKKLAPYCQKHKLKGFMAGSFMLGRFMCLSHPVEFWKAFEEKDIAWMLNEYILFEKYMNVLNEVGEREVNRARKKILNEGLGHINLKTGNAMIFISLKLSKKNLEEVKNYSVESISDEETIALINLLMEPYGKFYDYDAKWSLSGLRALCEEASLELPAAADK
jgi:hypothetical protein